MERKRHHLEETLEPLELEQLTWLTRRQAEVYLRLSPQKFREFVEGTGVPFRVTNTQNPKSKRTFNRLLLDQAMLADMHRTGLSEQGEQRVLHILGEEL